MTMDPKSASLFANQSYSDVQGLQKLKGLKPEDQKQAVSEIAKQFESIMLQMMLKSMRAANDALSEGGLFSSNEMSMRRDMLDQQLTLSMTEGRGTGIAELFERQLLRDHFNEQDGGEKVKVDAEIMQQRDLRRSTQRTLSNTITPLSKLDPEFEQELNDANVFSAASPADFVKSVMPHAEKAAQRLGVEPSVLVAQAALETGWGKFVEGNNFFGIKAGSQWQGDSQNIATHEYQAGERINIQDTFRQYDKLADSFDDYSNFIANSQRYGEALEATSSQEYMQKLQQAGYATDPKYAEKVIRLMQSPAFNEEIN